MEANTLRSPDWASLDWRAIGVMTIGAGCLCYEGLMRGGGVSYPMPGRIDGTQPYVVVAWGMVPFLFAFFLGLNPLRYFLPGRWRDTLPAFCVLLVATCAAALWLSSLGSVRAFYSDATLNFTFVTGTFVTMIAGEFFFRGFLLLPLLDRFGWYAVPVCAMPYGLIHLGKPVPEVWFSIVFAFALGYVAARSGSIWYSVVLHFTMAVGTVFFIGLTR